MASQLSTLLTRTTKTLTTTSTTTKPQLTRAITTSTFLSQHPQPEPASQPDPTPLPPNPATGSPIYSENWRNPLGNPNSPLSQSVLTPIGLSPALRVQTMSDSLDTQSLLDVFADWTATQRWSDMKRLFEMWIRSLDRTGKPNKPNVDVYNHYLRANLMLGASAGELLDLVAQMDDFGLLPNTASFNFVLKAMHQANETEAAQKLLSRMEQTGKESHPDNESYDLVMGALFATDQIDAALSYVDKMLKSGYTLSTKVFAECVRSCVTRSRLEVLVSIIEKCKKMDQNKALCPPWPLCTLLADVAMQNDNSKLAYYAFEFMAKWIAVGEVARPALFLSPEEGQIMSALATAGRTYSPSLLDAAWAILRRSLREKVASPGCFIGKIYAYAQMGNLQKAFATLREFECAYENAEEREEIFSPFTSLNPLAVACSKNGFETLDSVYLQLENLSRAEHPYKSVAALNCIILGCANIWDLDRAYQTFEAIGSSFGLTPDIHSYNALMYAFGRLKKTFEASKVFDHLVSLGVAPNAMSYSLLVDAHLINRDVKVALPVIDEMVNAGFVPTKEMLKKVRRRCIREMDHDSDDRVQSLAKKFSIRMGSEAHRDTLFNLDYSTEYAS